MKKGEIQRAEFWLAGLLCILLAVVKLAWALPWSWWRVLLPFWVLLWHGAVYIAVGFIWLTWRDAAAKGIISGFGDITGSTDTNSGAWCAQRSSWTTC